LRADYHGGLVFTDDLVVPFSGVAEVHEVGREAGLEGELARATPPPAERLFDPRP
jgi:hypothetical protein